MTVFGTNNGSNPFLRHPADRRQLRAECLAPHCTPVVVSSQPRTRWSRVRHTPPSVAPAVPARGDEQKSTVPAAFRSCRVESLLKAEHESADPTAASASIRTRFISEKWSNGCHTTPDGISQRRHDFSPSCWRRTSPAIMPAAARAQRARCGVAGGPPMTRQVQRLHRSLVTAPRGRRGGRSRNARTRRRNPLRPAHEAMARRTAPDQPSSALGAIVCGDRSELRGLERRDGADAAPPPITRAGSGDAASPESTPRGYSSMTGSTVRIVSSKWDLASTAAPARRSRGYRSAFASVASETPARVSDHAARRAPRRCRRFSVLRIVPSLTSCVFASVA